MELLGVEGSYTNLPNVIFKPLKMKIWTIQFSFLGILKKKSYLLSDQSYGEWVIFQKKVPRFYFYAFNEAGDPNLLTRFIQDNKLNFEKALLMILKSHGYQDVTFEDNTSAKLGKGAYEDLDLLEILPLAPT